jgi:hypothetical protein
LYKTTGNIIDTEKILGMKDEEAIKEFPYTDEGSLEDDIDNAKRQIYKRGFHRALELIGQEAHK